MAGFRILHLALAWLACLPLHAQVASDNARLSTPFNVRTWLVEDGLPNNVVTAVAEDSRGFIWIGTLTGVARFDGTEFKSIPLPPELTARGLNIRGLAVEPDDTIVVLTASSRVFRYREGRFAAHPIDAATGGQSLHDLHVDASGALWLTTAEPTLLRWHQNTTTVFSQADGLNRRGMQFTFGTDSSGRTWIAGGDFLGYHEHGRLHRFEGTPTTSVLVASSSSGGVWVASRERLARMEHGTLVSVIEGDGWSASRSGIQSMLEDRDGVLWIGTRRHGAWFLRDGSLVPATQRNDQVNALTQDKAKNVWIASNGNGLSRLRPREHLVLGTDAGLPNEISTAVSLDEQGGVWCANQSGGLVRVRDGQVTLVPARNPRRPPYVSTVSVDRSGRVWYGGPSGLLRTRVDTPAAVESIAGFETVRNIVATRDGDVWISADRPVLSRFRGHTLHPIAGVDQLPERISALAEDPAGALWIATEDGRLLIARDDAAIEFQAPAEDRPTRIHSMCFDATGALWIASFDGLYRFAGDRFRRFTREHGLPDDVIHQVVDDRQGTLWVGTRKGVFSISIQEIAALADGVGAGRLKARQFGRRDGLIGTSTILGGQPTAWASGDGRVWFCTHRGVIGFAAAASLDAPTAPPTYIEEVNVDGQPVPLTGALRLDPNPTRLVLRLTTPNFIRPEEIRLRYRLEGFDPDWIDAGSARTAILTRVPPGSYRFRAAASDESGSWTGSEAVLAIHIAPAWWQSVWLRLLVGAALAAAALGLGRALSHQLLRRRVQQLERERVLERERARIARNLHDELGGSVTRIGLLAERLHRQAAEPGLASGLEHLAGHARRLATDLEGIIWTVNAQNESWARLAGFIGDFAARFFAETAISCSVAGADSVPDSPIAPETLHHVLAITKEALNNGLKHARATSLHITMAVSEQTFTLSIRDNGRGFDPRDPAHSERNGLSNMQTRAAEIEGQLAITSSREHGTEIRLTVALDARLHRRA